MILKDIPQTHPYKHTQSGATLIEVLVSVFILGLGIAALVMTQVRTSSGVQEADNRFIIAQATQNLAEDIMLNPTLSISIDPDNPDKQITKISYSDYVLSGCANQILPAAIPAGGTGRSVAVRNQKTMANTHLAQFCNQLGFGPNVNASAVNNAILSGVRQKDIQLLVCHNEPFSSDVIVSDIKNLTCSGNGNDTVIKIVWQVDSKNNSNKVIRSYELLLPR